MSVWVCERERKTGEGSRLVKKGARTKEASATVEQAKPDKIFTYRPCKTYIFDPYTGLVHFFTAIFTS